MASRTCGDDLRLERLAPGPAARSSGVLRSCQSSSRAKTTPQLVWLVEVITFRPSSATVCSTPSWPRQSASTRWMTSAVFSPLVPSGVWTTQIR